ncbi:hypothetical protein D3C81_1400640 [compost metagenome]
MTFVQGEVQAPGQRGQQDQQAVGVDAAQAAITGDHDAGATHPQHHTSPTPGADAVVEDEMCQQRAEQRSRLRQHAGGAGTDPALTEIQRNVVQAHGKQSQHEQQWQVAQAR